MVPSIRKSELVLVSRLSYTFEPLEHLFDFRWQSPERGDLLVFRTPYKTFAGFSEKPLEWVLSLLTFGNPPSFLNSESPFEEMGYQVRRVVGIPGDTLEFRLGEWYIKNDDLGTATSELLLSEREYRPRLPEVRSGLVSPFGDSSFPFTLGDDEWFVAADNRTGALDSRHYGVISFREIQGRVVLRYSPLSRFGLL
jgi:signal peptidase I